MGRGRRGGSIALKVSSKHQDTSLLVCSTAQRRVGRSYKLVAPEKT